MAQIERRFYARQLEAEWIDSVAGAGHYYVVRSRKTYELANGSGGSAAEPRLLLLVSLAAGPKHGYAMMDDVERFAGVRMGPGTLYGALSRLERDGLVEPVESDDRRRPYRLTEAGGQALHAELDGIRHVVEIGRSRLTAR